MPEFNGVTSSDIAGASAVAGSGPQISSKSPRLTDVAIVGGGVAGSMAAAMLGKAGYDAVLIDIHQDFPRDFRCEKLDAGQLAVLAKTGLSDAVFPATTQAESLWVVRVGQKIEKKKSGEWYFYYDQLVNAVRGEMPSTVPFIAARMDAISTSSDRQTIALSSGDTISARLVVLANGLNLGPAKSLGIGRQVLSTCHSLSIGFDLRPKNGGRFPFPALTIFPIRASERMAYLTLFPIGEVMRANLFVYRDMKDPWLGRLREEPEKTLCDALPGLEKYTGDFEVLDRVKIRPIDLYVSTAHKQPGVVLVGDAYSTSCPAAGTGVTKVLVDVERLCNKYIPEWLASEGMGAEKIAAFYDDPEKVANEAQCLRQAFRLRDQTLQTGAFWRARHWAVSLAHMGVSVVQRA